MDDASKNALSKNIEDKLDEFFAEDERDSSSISAPEQRPALEKLKSMVLSIDWEITDECLTGLVMETEALIDHYQDDRPTNALLRMLKALANYIRKHKAQAHQEAIKRVMSVYASLESIVEEHSFDEVMKKRIVAAEINAFNQLKEQVGVKSSIKKTAGADSTAASLQKQLKEFNEVKAALSDLETRVNSQIEQLKNQLDTIKTGIAGSTKP